MKLPRPLAWALLLSGFFTAGLLRRFHDNTPESPFVHPVVGSLLFAAILILLLVSAWEHRRGAVGGRGVRLGTLTPLLLMLFLEKWVSTSFYGGWFSSLGLESADALVLDRWFALFAGALLLLWCLLFRQLSPFLRNVLHRWIRFRGIPEALLSVGLATIGVTLTMGLLGKISGASWHLGMPLSAMDSAWTWLSQGMLSFAEEVYYRGILLAETWRIAPRLGISSPAPRRWLALGTGAALFGMEHLNLDSAEPDLLRQWLFAMSLGALFGLIVLLRRNLWTAALLHTWINALLLGAAPRWLAEEGVATAPPALYIGAALLSVFGLLFLIARLDSNQFMQR